MKKQTTIILFSLLSFSSVAMAGWSVPFSPVSGDLAIASNPDSAGAVNSVVLVLQSIALLLSVLLFIQSGRRAKDEDYEGALRAFIAAMIAGISPYLAQNFFLF